MCLIIHKPKNILVNRSLLKSALTRNPDGWGIMYHNESSEGVTTLKGLAEDDFYNSLEKIEKDYELFIHLRMRTHGSVDEDNCHPFALPDGSFLMHNGTMTNVPECPTRTRSDTAMFCELVGDLLKNIPDYIHNEVFHQLVTAVAGSDRIVILARDGRHYKLGKGTWNTYDKLSLSNTYAWNVYTAPANGTRLTTPSGHYKPASAASTSTTTSAPNYSPAQLVPVPREERPDDFSSTKIYEQGEINLTRSDEGYDLQASLASILLAGSKTYTLTELLNMKYSQLRELIWSNPDVAITAIYEANLTV